MKEFDLDSAIRRVHDFPKKGILYYDITSILTNPEAFNYCFDKMKDIYAYKKIDAVAACESRGFLFAAPFAREMNLPLILVRKAGKLPGDTFKKAYNLEYGTAEVEIHKGDVPKGKNILLVDDLIATGGTLNASIDLFKWGGAKVTDIFAVIGLPFLGFPEALDSGIEVNTLVDFHSE